MGSDTKQQIMDICETALIEEGMDVLGGSNACELTIVAPGGNKYKLSLESK